MIDLPKRVMQTATVEKERRAAWNEPVAFLTPVHSLNVKWEANTTTARPTSTSARPVGATLNRTLRRAHNNIPRGAVEERK